MSDKTTKPPLFVRRSDSKRGSFWHILSNKRIIRQHGGFDIPDDDLHAVPQYHSPVEISQESPEEIKAELSGIEKEINELKEKEERQTTPTKNKKTEDDDPFDYED